MDIEQLTKAQIVLLVLLVSFVTSIATGIVTVTLLDQAPPAVTQTINRVVEHTVERVVPGIGQKEVITKTVVVNEGDLVAKSIEKNTSVLVRIFENTQSGAFLGLGVIATQDGIVATDSTLVSTDSTYRLMINSGEFFDANVIRHTPENSIALLKIVLPETSSEDETDSVSNNIVTTFTPALFSNVTNLKLGQTVVALSGEEYTNVTVGIISGLPMVAIEKIFAEVSPDEEVTEDTPLFDNSSQLGSIVSHFIGDEEDAVVSKENTSVEYYLSLIETNIKEDKTFFGSPLVNVSGEVVGIKTSEGARNSNYVPASVLVSELSAFAESEIVISKEEGNTE